MSTDNVQILRAGYEAFARRDIPAVLAAFSQDIVWRVPDSVPYGGDYRGHEGVTEFFGLLPEYWQELTVEPLEFIDAGDTIAVPARVTATGVGGSTVIESLHLWRMGSGKATSFTEYTDTARELRAAGYHTATTVQ